MQTESKQQIFARRKEIEQEIMAIFKKTGSVFSLQDVKKIIFYEEESGDMMKILPLFGNGGEISELENTLELISNAWNYFPHKSLGGLSPMEKLTER
jgi:hypothetical protein